MFCRFCRKCGIEIPIRTCTDTTKLVLCENCRFNRLKETQEIELTDVETV